MTKQKQDPNELFSVKKTLLHVGFVEDDLAAIYEIVISNKSKYNVTHLSIKDSFSGLLLSNNEPNKNELKKELTNVRVQCCSDTIKVNTFEDIVENNGELLNKCSYIKPYEVCSVIVRITANDRLITSVEESKQKETFFIRNSSIVRGKFSCTRGCVEYPLCPVHVVSEGFTTDSLTNAIQILFAGESQSNNNN